MFVLDWRIGCVWRCVCGSVWWAEGGMVEYRQNYTAIVVYFSCGVCLWGRWEAMLVIERIEALGCFTKTCVCVCFCVCVCVGAEAGTGAGQTIGPRGSCIVPYCQLSPSAAAGFWWMRCWINNSRNPCHSAVIAIQRPGSAFAPVHRWPDGATRCSL